MVYFVMHHQNLTRHALRLALFFLWTIWIKGEGICQNSNPTNLELLAGLSTRLADECILRMGMKPGDKVIIVENQNASEISKWITLSFNEGLFNNGLVVFTNEDSIKNGIAVSFTVTKAWIGYERSYRKSFLGSKWIIRSGDVHIFLSGVDHPNGQIVWTGNLEISKRDTIPEATLDSIEQGGEIIGKPQRPAVRGAQKWIEPILIAGALGSVVYLFYSVRSR
jgi:hypothetical protein